MFKIDFKNVLTMLAQHELDKIKTQPVFKNGEITREGVYIEFSLEAREWQKKERRAHFYVLFCGNVSVFYASACDETGNFLHGIHFVPVEKWINTSNHDSCWRSDGLDFISKYYFTMCKEINPNKAPINIDTEARFFWSYPVKKCMITYKKPPGNDYRNAIVKVEPIR